MEEYRVNNEILNSLNNNSSPKVQAIENYAKAHNVPILRTVTANLLKSVISLKKPKKILEIGTAIGFSGILMLENCEGAKLDTIEKMPENVVLASENFKKFGLEKQVKIFEGDAFEVLKNLKSKYDFVFLDGPKGQYIKYLGEILRLLNSGGVLFADNVLYRKMVFSEMFIPRKKRAIVNNLQKFLTEISNNKILKTQILNVEDGVSISIKE